MLTLFCFQAKIRFAFFGAGLRASAGCAAESPDQPPKVLADRRLDEAAFFTS
jgi:hypothetical protein